MRVVGSSGFRFASIACLAFVSAMLGGCADSRGGPIAYNVANFGAPDAPVSTAIGAGYRIAPMDTLAIKVFGMPDLSGDYQVDHRGKLSMPLIGDVEAMSYTPAQLDQILTKRYSQKYLENPDISVGIKAATGHNVTVDGAVTQPGAYPVLGPMTLMQAVAVARGTTDLANEHRVAIFRTIDGKRQAAAFDLVSIRHGQMKDPAIYSGDIVIVDGSGLKEAQKKIFQAVPLLNIFRPF
jgi:polysaccharide export outer membrane protein